ncbi:MAG TPA: GNAT family N-acetyltransferase [Gaiellaceae bacterium]|jgi:ribosomal protein S18 acetylase RimI-like enzyme|nr:GNAT family N-acetyltransferase [Gaiellaceae bacterium]
MHARYADRITIRPLRDGDTATVQALFDRLGARSRARRFGGAKPRLSEIELQALARVDATHHSLVAYVDGDPEPAGLAQLVRRGPSAEVACAVADEHQSRGVGTALTRELAADARAAGIVWLQATVQGDNPPAVSLLARCSLQLDVRWRGGERAFLLGL